MKAIAIQQWGGPVEYLDLPDPKVSPDQVLIRVRSIGVNPADWKVVEGGGMDEWFEVHFPLILGYDVAGVVERVGPAVTQFAPGDEVIAGVREDHIGRGTYAELASVPVRMVARKPSNISWAQAGALPTAALTAYQGLHRVLGVGAGDVVVIHAAAGGVGSTAVQVALALGASRVIGTASEANHDYLHSLGAEPVTYGEGLVERIRELVPEGADAVLDLVGGETLDLSFQLIGDGGRVAAVVMEKYAGNGLPVFSTPDGGDLQIVADMVQAGQVQVNVSKTYALQDAARAHAESQAGHVRGKLVLEVA
ncbi:MAG: putative oxidoreductase [Solirubrobacterales bacterium]|nr:putative oxidoreductase [Solirubrobacterales bacterium]